MRGNLLVTGAAGFIGSHLCAALVCDGWDVIGLDNFDASYRRELKLANLWWIERIAATAATKKPGSFRFCEQDACDLQAMRDCLKRHQPQSVFHLAARTGVRASIAQPRAFADVNINGLLCVLEACRAAGCRRVVFASSSSVYGNATQAPFAENHCADDPISPYAATKRAGEMICQAYAQTYGLRIGALRFFTVYGPAQRPDLAIASFMRLIDSGEAVPMFGDGTTSRDYTYVDDVVTGVLAAWQRVIAAPAVGDGGESGAGNISRAGELAGGGYFRVHNLGSDRPITLHELIAAISNTVGRQATIQPMPMQTGDVMRTWADLTRSRRELSFVPGTPLKIGLNRQWQAMVDSRDSIDGGDVPVVHTIDRQPATARRQ